MTSNIQIDDTLVNTNSTNNNSDIISISIDLAFVCFSFLSYTFITNYYSYKKLVRVKELELEHEKVLNESKKLDIEKMKLYHYLTSIRGQNLKK